MLHFSERIPIVKRCMTVSDGPHTDPCKTHCCFGSLWIDTTGQQDSPYPCGRRRRSSLLACFELSLELLDGWEACRLLQLLLVWPHWFFVLLDPELRTTQS